MSRSWLCQLTPSKGGPRSSETWKVAQSKDATGSALGLWLDRASINLPHRRLSAFNTGASKLFNASLGSCFVLGLAFEQLVKGCEASAVIVIHLSILNFQEAV